MDPDLRIAILLAGLLFVLLFGLLTLSVVAESGLDILTVTSFAIVVIVGVGLISAIRNPPRR